MSRSGNNPFSNFFSSRPPLSSRTPQQQPQPPPPPPPPPPPSNAFFCPISTLLMSNPVVTPSGHTFDLPCIEACRDLNYTPPHLNLNITIPPYSSDGDTFPLIRNVAIYQAILDWCNRSGHPLPIPISRSAARHFVRGLKSISIPPPPPLPLPSSCPIDYNRERSILKKLEESRLASQESALHSLMKNPLCSPRILAAIIPFLTTFPGSELQTLAAQVIHTFSHDPSNPPQILRAGAVPPLITVLLTGTFSGCVAATGTFYRLSVEESNRIAIGALGAIPPLLNKCCQQSISSAVQMDAALALYHLSQSCQVNARVVVENGGVGRLIELAGDENLTSEMRRHALMLVQCLMGVEIGRAELMGGSGRAIKLLLRMGWQGEGIGLAVLGVMYRLCRESLQMFRDVVGAAGGEGIFVEEREDWGEMGKEMAREMVRVIRGEFHEGEKLREMSLEIEKGPVEKVVVDKEETAGKRWKKKLKEKFRKMVKVKRGDSSEEQRLLEGEGAVRGEGGKSNEEKILEEVVKRRESSDQQKILEEKLDDEGLDEMIHEQVNRVNRWGSGRRLEKIDEDEREGED